MKIYFKKKIIFLTLLGLLVLFFTIPVNVYTEENFTGFEKQIQESLSKFLKTGAPSNLNISQIIDLIKVLNIDASGKSDMSQKVIEMGKDQFEKGDKTSAIELFKYALEGLNKDGDNKALAEGLKEIGKFFEQKGDKNNALEFLLRAVDASVLAKDQPGLSELLKNLEPLLKWQETQGSIPIRINTKEEEKQAGSIEIAKITLPDGKIATIIIPNPPQTDKQGSEKKQKQDKEEKIKTAVKEHAYVVEKTTLPGDVLACTGPKISNLYAYEDMSVKKEWSAKYINPLPGGRYAPYAGDTGLDIIAPRGLPFFAAKSGIILYSSGAGHCRQRGPNDDQGAMRIHHPDGTDTFYAHLSGRNAQLKAGSVVTQGQWMGNIGKANNVPHLHFTIYYSGGKCESSFSTPSKLYNPWKVIAMIIKIWLQ